MWTAEIELATPLPAGGEDALADAWIDAMAEYSPVITRSALGNGVLVFSLEAETLRKATDLALLVVADRLPDAEVLIVRVMDADIFDSRALIVDIPPLISVTEAAERTGRTRGAIWKRIKNGTLAHQYVGKTLVIPAAALSDLAEDE